MDGKRRSEERRDYYQWISHENYRQSDAYIQAGNYDAATWYLASARHYANLVAKWYGEERAIKIQQAKLNRLRELAEDHEKAIALKRKRAWLHYLAADYFAQSDCRVSSINNLQCGYNSAERMRWHMGARDKLLRRIKKLESKR